MRNLAKKKSTLDLCKTIGMFTAAFTLMEEGQWEASTSTTNPVESINRES